MRLIDRLKDASLEEIKEVLLEQEREITELRQQVKTPPVAPSNSSDLLNAKRIERATAVITDHLKTLKEVVAPEIMSGVHEVVLNILTGKFDSMFGI